MKIHIVSAYPDPEPIATFRAMAAMDSVGRHQTVDAPELADIILFVENSHYHDDRTFHRLIRHPLVRRYREKCMMYNEHDNPWCVLPGVYCSMPVRYFTRTRLRAGPYVKTVNPYIDRIAASEADPDLLYSFVGARNVPVRDRVLELPSENAVIKDTTQFKPHEVTAAEGQAAFQFYADVLTRSRFVLCPRGAGTSSFRLFETMQAARVPVILADQWAPPEGPDWESFAVRIPEADVASTPSLLAAYSTERWQEMRASARAAWETWFGPDVLFDYIAEGCCDILRSRRVPERYARFVPHPAYVNLRAHLVLEPVLRRLRPLRRRIQQRSLAQRS
ncbi:MAG TPA: exostosin family protein [Armatimonadota bacterium]|jgi:hypothetical protein